MKIPVKGGPMNKAATWTAGDHTRENYSYLKCRGRYLRKTVFE